MGERRGRPCIPDLNQPALPDLNYPPPPPYSYGEEVEQPPPLVTQHVWNVDQVIAAAIEGEGSADTTASSKPKIVEEPKTENGSYWSNIKKALKRTLSKLSTVTKDAPAE